MKGIPLKNAKWELGLATVTGVFTGALATDMSQIVAISKDIEQLVDPDSVDFFGDDLAGKFKKTKVICTKYSILLDYGPHRQEETSGMAT